MERVFVQAKYLVGNGKAPTKFFFVFLNGWVFRVPVFRLLVLLSTLRICIIGSQEQHREILTEHYHHHHFRWLDLSNLKVTLSVSYNIYIWQIAPLEGQNNLKDVWKKLNKIAKLRRCLEKASGRKVWAQLTNPCDHLSCLIGFPCWCWCLCWCLCRCWCQYLCWCWW